MAQDCKTLELLASGDISPMCAAVFSIVAIIMIILSNPGLALSNSAPGSTPPTPEECKEIEVLFKDDPSLTREERVKAMDKALARSLGRYDECQRILSQGGGAGSSAGGGQGGAGSGKPGNGQEGTDAADQSGNGKEGADASGQAAEGKEGADASERPGEEKKGSGDSPPTGAGRRGQLVGEAPNPVKSVATSDISGPMKSSGQLPGANGQGADGDRKDEDPEQEQGGASPQGDLAGKPGSREGQPAAVAHSNGKIPEDIPSADNDSVLERQIREAAMREKDPAVQAKLWNEYRRYKGLPQQKK